VKKRPVLLILFLTALSIWAQDDAFEFNPADDRSFFESDIWEPKYTEDGEYQETPAKKKFRFKNRMVELSVANVSVNASNDFIAAKDILRNPFYMLGNIKNIQQDPRLIYNDPAVINIDDFFSGFMFNSSTAIKPFSLNFNWKDNWGVGLDIGHIDILGNVTIPERVLRLKEAEETFGVGGAVFADAGIPVFFHYNDFKIKLRPAVYVPVVYAEPNISYSYKTGPDGMRLEVDYDMRFYSVVNMEGIDKGETDPALQALQNNYWNILRNNLGYDFGLGVEYPWDYWLDLGVDIVNIPVPFAAAKLNHYIQLRGSASVDTSTINLIDLMNGEGSLDDIFDYNGPTLYRRYDQEGKAIYRPFKMLFYASYRPFDTIFLSFIPSLGFSINTLYPKREVTGYAWLEGGLSARLDLANIFIPTLGINYNDRRWINSIDLILNLRAFEVNFGLSFQSPNFIKSWQGAGAGVNFGLKFGW